MRYSGWLAKGRGLPGRGAAKGFVVGPNEYLGSAGTLTTETERDPSETEGQFSPDLDCVHQLRDLRHWEEADPAREHSLLRRKPSRISFIPSGFRG